MRCPAMGFSLLLVLGGLCSCQNLAKSTPTTETATIKADDAVVQVAAYGKIDLEGAKLTAIVVEYRKPIDPKSVNNDTYAITDYVQMMEGQQGIDSTIERDADGVLGNEGKVMRAYVNDRPEPSAVGGTATGRYVILEINSAYLLSGQNLSYTTTMMAGVRQTGEVRSGTTRILPSETEFANYTKTTKQNDWNGKDETVISTDKTKILLPEFAPGSGWTFHRMGDGAFPATHAYSEYTGRYEDFELPYSLYVPAAEVLEAHRGHIALVLHMEHAGANDTDPMAAVTSSKAAVKLASPTVQTQNPAIIVVPQIEEKRRSTNDVDASSEANTAIWELVDSLLKQYGAYIDTNRIYGTGQSM